LTNLAVTIRSLKAEAHEWMRYLVEYLTTARLFEILKFKSLLHRFVWPIMYNKRVPDFAKTVQPLANRVGVQFPTQTSHKFSLFLRYLKGTKGSCGVLRELSTTFQIHLLNIHSQVECCDTQKLELFEALNLTTECNINIHLR
jgi:hypothetical protein